MSPLDAAKALRDKGPLAIDDEHPAWCVFCDAEPPQPHVHGCPWLQMPAIIAVLEAAERVMVNPDEPVNTIGIDQDQVYAICDETAWPTRKYPLDWAT